MFATALSRHPDPRVAVGEVVGEVLERVGPAPDLAVLFFTAPHLPAAHEIAASIQTLVAPRAFIGASGSAVLGGAEGIEDAPGLVLWTARLPGVVTPFHFRAESDGAAIRLRGLDPAVASAGTSMLLLADPFTFPADEVIAALANDQPRLAVIGGFASAAQGPGRNRLVIGGELVTEGAVGVLLDEAASPSTVVSQGCRPIGRPFTVTASTDHLIEELGGRPALERLSEIVASLSPEDRQLAGQGLHCGVVINVHQLDFERGDFLIRGVLGADRRTGAVAVGDLVPVGATIQFQVRDPATAGADLQTLLGGHAGEGALVFTCNGRGTFMFGNPHHDARIVSDHLGAAAVAGMFCAGELGPVGGRNALHGFTASVALFGGRGTG
jgi:small ligand-binding sensory domain FIST